MSYSGVKYAVEKNYLSNNLRVHYDFSTGNIGAAPISDWNAYVSNLAYSGQGIMDGYILGANGPNQPSALILGRNFIENDSGNLKKNNVHVGDLLEEVGINLNNCSSVIIFENSGEYHDGVLFGSLNKVTETYNGEDYESYEGFNVGITKRGHLFFHSYTEDGPFIKVLTQIELFPKNIISFNIGENEVVLSRYNIATGIQISDKFNFDTSKIGTPSNFYLGGSPTYYRSTGFADKTFSGSINGFALFSGYLNETAFTDVAEGMLGEYYYESGQEFYTTKVTGQTASPIYATGVTGYSLSVTGYRLTPTGFVETDSILPLSPSYVNEGYRYFTNQGNSLEEQGFLSTGLFGTYNTTGETAFSTLGLQQVSGLVTGYYLERDTSILYASTPLYQQTPITGYTSQITGYSEVMLSGLVYSGEIAASSGVIFDLPADSYKFNFIHFLG